MAKWKCTVCEYIYDEEEEGKAFGDLPDGWLCPACGVGKEAFEKVEQNESYKRTETEHLRGWGN